MSPRRYSMVSREEAVAATRRRIVEALMGLIAEKPYPEITVEDIARRADVSPRTVHRHFAGKGHVLTKCGEMIQDLIGEGLAPLLLAESPVQAFRSLVNTLYERYEQYAPLLLALIPVENTVPDVRAMHEVRRRTLRALVEQIVDSWPDGWRVQRQEAVTVLSSLANFRMWAMLALEYGLSLSEAADIAVGLAESLLQGSHGTGVSQRSVGQLVEGVARPG